MKKFLLSLLCLVGFTAAQAETFVIADQWGSSTTDLTKWTSGTYTFTPDKAQGSNTPAYNKSGDARLYQKNTFTITTTGENMKSVSFTISNQGKKRMTTVTASTGEMTVTGADAYICSWTGDASTVTFTVGEKATLGTDGETKAGQLCFTQIDISTEATSSEVIVAAPTITPFGGMISMTDEISISAEEGATIYYTIDGEDPTTTSTQYTAPFTITDDTVVKAIAVKDEKESTVTSASFYIATQFGYVKSITSGKKYLIVADDAEALKPQESGNYGYLYTVDVTPTDGYITSTKQYAFTITEVEGGYSIQDSYGKYLYAIDAQKSFQFTTDATADIVWNIELQDDGTMKMTHVSTGRYAQYSASYSSFGVYTDAQGLLPALYEEGATAEEKPAEQLETATSIANFYEITGKVVGAKAIIGFELSVIAVAGSNIYVTDGQGNFSCVYKYNSGISALNVIASGWEASYGEYKGLFEIVPVDAISATGATATIPEPKEISGEEIASDLQSVYVKIADVTVTPAATGTFTGTDEDGTEISFYNKFNTAVPESNATIYDVIGIVSIYDTSLQIYPLEYTPKNASAIEDVEVESNEAVEYYNLQGVKVDNPENGLYIRKQGSKATKVLVK